MVTRCVNNNLNNIEHEIQDQDKDLHYTVPDHLYSRKEQTKTNGCTVVDNLVYKGVNNSVRDEIKMFLNHWNLVRNKDRVNVKNINFTYLVDNQDQKDKDLFFLNLNNV